MKFHKDGELAPTGHIWVFGSNLAGRHGAGAALVAVRRYGAEYRVGVGRRGYSYAIPTKDGSLKVLALDKIGEYVRGFIVAAELNPSDEFFVTSVGCGLAGYKPKDIAPLFKSAPRNCSFPHTWQSILEA
jgi:hypothetical protein